MRLWHKNLISVLPRQQLQGQWRECCLIAKELCKGTLNHLLVNRIKEYPMDYFYRYGEIVYLEMRRRGYNCNFDNFSIPFPYGLLQLINVTDAELFKGWHNHRYLKQCFYNLQEKYDCGGITSEEWAKICEYCEAGEDFEI